MLRHIRIIPRLDIKGPHVVKGVHTEGLRIVGIPHKLARSYYEHGGDKLVYMDIVASLYQRNLDFDLLRSVADVVFIPLTVGGGIRTIHDINNALRAGADKVAINTHAIKDPSFISEAAKRFGSQCIVLSIEAKKIAPNTWEAYTDGGREKTGVDAIAWAQRGIELGAGELLITSIDKDGTRQGYDTDLLAAINKFSPVPVIAHGGAGSIETMDEAVTHGGSDALCASSVFHYGEASIAQIKRS